MDFKIGDVVYIRSALSNLSNIEFKIAGESSSKYRGNYKLVSIIPNRKDGYEAPFEGSTLHTKDGEVLNLYYITTKLLVKSIHETDYKYIGTHTGQVSDVLNDLDKLEKLWNKKE